MRKRTVKRARRTRGMLKSPRVICLSYQNGMMDG
jgi:hypothetical protein